nr:hypothetical protein [Prevotella sp.]
KAARMLADALEKDFAQEPVDGGIHRYAETETFFDNYVNWSKTVCCPCSCPGIFIPIKHPA